MARPDLNDLKGFTVAITADRRRDEQAVLMERLGVEVIMFPFLQTRRKTSTVLRALTEKLVQEPPDYLVANTGYGMRTWLAWTAEWGVQDGLVVGLGLEDRHRRPRGQGSRRAPEGRAGRVVQGPWRNPRGGRGPIERRRTWRAGRSWSSYTANRRGRRWPSSRVPAP